MSRFVGFVTAGAAFRSAMWAAVGLKAAMLQGCSFGQAGSVVGP